jgi:hypothetical protein
MGERNIENAQKSLANFAVRKFGQSAKFNPMMCAIRLMRPATGAVALFNRIGLEAKVLKDAAGNCRIIVKHGSGKVEVPYGGNGWGKYLKDLNGKIDRLMHVERIANGAYSRAVNNLEAKNPGKDIFDDEGDINHKMVAQLDGGEELIKAKKRLENVTGELDRGSELYDYVRTMAKLEEENGGVDPFDPEATVEEARKKYEVAQRVSLERKRSLVDKFSKLEFDCSEAGKQDENQAKEDLIRALKSIDATLESAKIAYEAALCAEGIRNNFPGVLPNSTKKS